MLPKHISAKEHSLSLSGRSRVVMGQCWAAGAHASNSCHFKGPIKRGSLILHLAVTPEPPPPAPSWYCDSLGKIGAESW